MSLPRWFAHAISNPGENTLVSPGRVSRQFECFPPSVYTSVAVLVSRRGPRAVHPFTVPIHNVVKPFCTWISTEKAKRFFYKEKDSAYARGTLISAGNELSLKLGTSVGKVSKCCAERCKSPSVCRDQERTWAAAGSLSGMGNCSCMNTTRSKRRINLLPVPLIVLFILR